MKSLGLAVAVTGRDLFLAPALGNEAAFPVGTVLAWVCGAALVGMVAATTQGRQGRATPADELSRAMLEHERSARDARCRGCENHRYGVLDRGRGPQGPLCHP